MKRLFIYKGLELEANINGYATYELKLNTFVKFEDYMEWSNLNRTQKTAYGMQMNNFFAENEIYDEHGQRIEPWMN